MSLREDSELLRLPGVTRKREKRLRDYGYVHLWDIAEADVDELAEALAQQMITTTKYLVTIE